MRRRRKRSGQNVRGNGLVGGTQAVIVGRGAGADLGCLRAQAAGDNVLGFAAAVLGGDTGCGEEGEGCDELHVGDG